MVRPDLLLVPLKHKLFSKKRVLALSENDVAVYSTHMRFAASSLKALVVAAVLLLLMLLQQVSNLR